MSLQRINNWLISLIVISSCLTLGSYALSLYFFEVRLQANDQRNEVEHALAHIDKSLYTTSSALQAYASTGDTTHRSRFQTELYVGTDRKASLNLLQGVSLNASEKLQLQQFQTGYGDYVALATRIVEAVQRKDLATATTLVTDLEFRSIMAAQLEHLELLFSPDLFILGGGESKYFENFKELLTVSARVVPAKLLNNAGIIGAAVFAAEHTHGR